MTASPVEQVTKAATGLGRFVVAATLARMGDAGAGVGIVLLSVDRSPRHGALVGGLLVATLTAPHALGRWTGVLVDRAADPRRPLAAACAVYAVGVALAAVLVELRAPGPAAAPLAVAGACGPLLTGGLSSLVAGLGASVSRARGLDVLTYGIAGSAGPAAVAALAALSSPAVSVATIAATVLLAAILVRRLPAGPPPAAARIERERGTEPVGLLRSRPLRRVAVTTVGAAASGGALAVLAVLLAKSLTGDTGRGAWLVSALGIGTLAGSVVMAVRPLRAEPVRASVALAGALGGCYLLIAAAPAFGLALAAFALTGLVTAPWVTATLAARERYAPEGQRGQVFVALAGWKIGAAAAGTALAGASAGLGPRPVLTAAAGLTLLSVVVAAADRESPRSRSAGPR